MPVYSAHLLDYATFSGTVGERIRDERQRKRLTLREISRRIGISEAKLSNMENAKVSLDLSELCALAAVLEVPLSAFFPRTTIQHSLITRGEDLARRAPIARDLSGPEPGPMKHHNRVWPLADVFVGKHMEPLLVQIEPLDDDDLHFISHDHEEFMFVLRGEVETLLKTNEGLVTERLRAGDSIYFRSNLPHCHRSGSSGSALTLNVLYSLRGAIDPNDGELGSAGQRFYRRGVYANAAREASEKLWLLRRSHGLSLAELAERLGIGARLLAQIESGESAANVQLLLRAARHFRRPVEYFFATTLESQPFYFVQRGDEMKQMAPRGSRSGDDEKEPASLDIFRSLASGFPGRGVFPYYVQVRPQEPDIRRRQQYSGQEFLYVLDGELELIVSAGEQRTDILRAGDALFLDCSVPHILRGSSRNPYATTWAEAIAVFWSPFGEDDVFTRDDQAR